jgi:hypothetical protein
MERSRMTSLVIGVAALALILVRQVRARPLESGVVLVGVLGVLGLAETGAFLFGKQQFIAFVKGRNHHLVPAVPDVRMMIIAAVGSLVLAAVTGALRAPSERLWWQDGQVWRKGTAATVVLWLVSLGLHLGYDAMVAHGPDFGDATMTLYFAVSVASQRAALYARAWRLRDSGAGPRRHPVSSDPDRPW